LGLSLEYLRNDLFALRRVIIASPGIIGVAIKQPPARKQDLVVDKAMRQEDRFGIGARLEPFDQPVVVILEVYPVRVIDRYQIDRPAGTLST
jgi:hypothetical protein